MSTSSQGALPDVRLDGGEELRELVDAVPGQNVGELAAEEPVLLRPLHVPAPRASRAVYLFEYLIQ